jgi:type I restriction-modification system DNA methylase subunit
MIETVDYAPITFSTDSARPLVNEILKIVERAESRGQGYATVFTSSVHLMEAALAAQEDAYMEQVRRLDRDTVTAAAKIYGVLSKMYFENVVEDVLGMAYMEIASRWKCSGLGQFFTPMALCEMMAEMILGNVEEAIADARATGTRKLISDPACGSGAMLLGAKKVIMRRAGVRGLDHFRFTGQDVDPVCVSMCRVQMYLTDFRYMAARYQLVIAEGLRYSQD